MSTAPLHRRVPALLLAVLLLGTGLAGCSDDPGAGEPAADPSTAAAGPPPLATTVRLGEVVGRTRPPARRAAVRAVGRTVDRWVDAAYVGGPWPREDFSDAFPGFSRGARAQARADLRSTTNAALGRRVDGVLATRRRLVVDLLSDRRRRPVTATARLQLAFRTSGEVRRAVRVDARLFLTRTADGWRVFGYDLTRGRR